MRSLEKLGGVHTKINLLLKLARFFLASMGVKLTHKNLTFPTREQIASVGVFLYFIFDLFLLV